MTTTTPPVRRWRAARRALALPFPLALIAAAAMACGGSDLVLPGDPGPGAPEPVPVLGVVTQPAAEARAGAVLDRQPAVQLRDDRGQPMTQPSLAVTVAIASGGGTLRGTLTRVTDASGAAAFSDLAIDGEPGPRTLIFAAPGVASAVSEPVAVTAPPAAVAVALAFLTQPSAVRTETPIAPPVRIALVDADGATVPAASQAVSIAIVQGPKDARLSGTATVSPVDGIATFADLQFKKSGTYVLQASAPGLAAVRSVQFKVGR